MGPTDPPACSRVRCTMCCVIIAVNDNAPIMVCITFNQFFRPFQNSY